MKFIGQCRYGDLDYRDKLAVVVSQFNLDRYCQVLFLFHRNVGNEV